MGTSTHGPAAPHTRDHMSIVGHELWESPCLSLCQVLSLASVSLPKKLMLLSGLSMFLPAPREASPAHENTGDELTCSSSVKSSPTMLCRGARAVLDHKALFMGDRPLVCLGSDNLSLIPPKPTWDLILQIHDKSLMSLHRATYSSG